MHQPFLGKSIVGLALRFGPIALPRSLYGLCPSKHRGIRGICMLLLAVHLASEVFKLRLHLLHLEHELLLLGSDWGLLLCCRGGIIHRLWMVPLCLRVWRSPLSWLIPNTRRRLLRLLRLSVLLMFRCDVQNQSHLFIFVQVVFAQRVPDGACSTAGDGDVRAV